MTTLCIFIKLQLRWEIPIFQENLYPFTQPLASIARLLTRSLTLFPQQAADVATVIKETTHIADEVNDLKKMSSEELTKTVDVLKNVKKKMQTFNTSKKEAEELITVRRNLEQVLTIYNDKNIN